MAQDPNATLEPEEGPVGRVLSDKFRVLRKLGQGGMGAVYVAEHLYTKRMGALKLLKGALDTRPDVVERFVRESSAAGLIRSPHIVETWDAGILDSGEPYAFMELLHGQSMDALIDDRGRLPVAEACALVRQAALGLAAAHAADIVRRDIKPANLFVLAGPPPFVKLLDFGISKFAPRSDDEALLTNEGDLLGTPMYMSPEQVRGALDIDGRSDVFALGAVLYELLSGEPPFLSASVMEISVRICEGRYVSLSEARSGLPAELEPLVSEMLAVDRNRRPTAAQVAQRLAHFEGAEDALASGVAARVAFDQTLPSDSSELRPPTLRSSTPGSASGMAPPSRGRALWPFVAGVALVLGAWLWTKLDGAPPRPPGSEAAAIDPASVSPASPEPSMATQADSIAERPGIDAGPSRAAGSLQNVTGQAATQPAAHPPPAPARRRESPTPAPKGRPSSAAGKDGLAQDNPFAE